MLTKTNAYSKMLIMKNKLIICGILIIAVLLTACSASNIESNAEITEVITIEGNGRIYRSLQELLEPSDWGAGVLEDLSADLVVIGEFVEETDANFRYIYSDIYKKDVVINANAFNKLSVIEVLKGDVKIGDTIKVGQSYAFDEERGVMITFDGMTPMNKGDRWIYFLRYSKELSVYYSIGRYPVPNEEIKQAIEELANAIAVDEIVTADKIHGVETSSLGVLKRSSFDFNLYSEVLEHFQIEARDWVNPGQSIDERLIEMAGKDVDNQ